MNKIFKKLFIFCICVVVLANSASFTINGYKDTFEIYDIIPADVYDFKCKNKEFVEYIFKVDKTKFNDILKSYDITINIGDTIHIVDSPVIHKSLKLKTNTKNDITYTIERWLLEWEYVITSVENNTYKISMIIPPIVNWQRHVKIHENDYIRLEYNEDEERWFIKFFNNKTGKLQWQGNYESYYLDDDFHKIDVKFTGFCYKNDEPTQISIYPNKCN